MKRKLQIRPEHLNSYGTGRDDFNKQEPKKVFWMKSDEI